jgi:hypothetical protein
MSLADKISYNESSSEKYGWKPSWFGSDDYKINEEFIDLVADWQRERGLTDDSLIGPSTYKTIWLEREENISQSQPGACGVEVNTIVHNGHHFPIDWDNVVLWDEENGLKCDSGNYTSRAGKEDRKPTHFVNHWDVCLSTESMARVINRRGVSIHFGIDNDGTIYQLLDTQHRAWQAGHKYGNRDGIGIEIANAYYTKYQDTYVKRGHGERPIWDTAEVHGKTLDPFLGFYPVQLEALKALWKAIHLACDIPVECPTDENGELITTVDDDCNNGKFKGFICHYHLTRRKIDCAGLDLVGLCDDVKSML